MEHLVENQIQIGERCGEQRKKNVINLSSTVLLNHL